MLASYKEKKYLIVSLATVILDGIIVYFMPSYFRKINYLYPMLTITILPFLYKNNLKDFYKLCFIIGIVYDLLYSNIFLFNALVFLGMAKIDIKIMKYFQNSFFTFLFITIFNIIFYDSIKFLLVFFSNYQEVIIDDLLYKVSHSLILNLLSVFVFYFLFKRREDMHTM